MTELTDRMLRLEGEQRLAASEHAQVFGELDWLADHTEACKYRQYGAELRSACDSGRCEVGTLQKPLQQLQNLRDSYVVLQVRASATGAVLTGKQKIEVGGMLLRRVPRPTTRLLLIALPPRGESEADLRQAQQVAVASRVSIEAALGSSRDFHWLNPTAVGCNEQTRALFSNLKTHYTSYLAQQGKVPERIVGPSVTVILFRLDCLQSPRATGEPS